MSAKIAALLLAAASLMFTFQGVHAQQSSFQLWAYGGDVRGFPVYGFNGDIYAGQPPQSASEGVNLTFSEDSSDASKWLVTPSDGSPSQVLYAITTSGQYQAVKYSSNPPQGSTANGWSWMGNQVFRISDGKLTAQFWANPTGTNKWVIGWNSDNRNVGQAVPVALRRSPPSRTEPPGHPPPQA